MSTVKVGQVWRDKDKRRNTIIEIIDTVTSDSGNLAVGLVVGTEEEREYLVDRILKRWEMVVDKSDEDEPFEWDGKGSMKTLAEHAHVHRNGECIKNRNGVKCDVPQASEHAGDMDLQQIHKTREEWLNAAVDKLREGIFGKEHPVPEVRVSVGWPGGRGPKQNTIGQCWHPEQSADGIGQIFISPVLSAPVEVLETLVHELVHAINHKNGDNGHRAPFKRIAEPVGLEGEMTSTHAGEELAAKLEEIGDQLGKYPHAAINLADKPKVQKTYMLKFVSPEEPDFFVRMTASKLEEYGAPRDPWGNEMEQEL